MLRAVKLQFIFVFIIIAIFPCPTYAYSKESSMFRGVTCVTNDIILFIPVTLVHSFLAND